MMSDPANSQEALLQFLYLAPVGLVQVSADGAIGMLNPLAANLLMPMAGGGDLDNLFDVLLPFGPDLRRLAAGASAPDGLLCDDLRVRLEPAGGHVAQVISIRMLRLDAVRLVVSLTDVTDSVEGEARRLASTLRTAARTDPLTKLPNRSVAIERVAAALETASGDPAFEFAVLFVDCDRFDRINTAHGSAVGDALLGLVGERLNGAIRLADGMVRGAAEAHRAEAELPAARLGGDEFVLVPRGLRSAADAEGLARRLVEALALPFTLGATTIHLTASIGVVPRRHAAGDPEAVLQSANIAMHEAKRAGGGCVAVFDPAMQVLAARRSRIETELRRAITGAELFVVYQPIVAMATGACVGVEALVRWRHPERGIVPPIEFIEIAEESGLIVELGDFVLVEACRQLARWQRELGAAAPVLISVNLSRAQLRHGPFEPRVRQALEACGLPAAALQLEITESLAAQDTSVQAQLAALKRLGVSLALDDFGTGYSSLSSLHLLPVDVVKIDRSFVSQVGTSLHHQVLIEATVKVAGSLGMTTVAEGIETDGQHEQLRRLGCDKGQGYLHARPLAAGEATRWLVERMGVAVA